MSGRRLNTKIWKRAYELWMDDADETITEQCQKQEQTLFCLFFCINADASKGIKIDTRCLRRCPFLATERVASSTVALHCFFSSSVGVAIFGWHLLWAHVQREEKSLIKTECKRQWMSAGATCTCSLQFCQRHRFLNTKVTQTATGELWLMWREKANDATTKIVREENQFDQF